MTDVVIKVDNLSKQYRLGEMGTGTISHDLNRWWYKVRGKADPYLKIGEKNDRTQKGSSDYVWAIRDVNFEVKRGEVVGIIGRNGAGKSTLLKMLSRITAPTTGTIKSKGRIASLLEVGTGFHDELTGRENIFLNGAIMGMTKAEVRAKLDEIVDFSGTERYLNTPVKRYSSGMRVRLGFAVAAHLEPEVLIVDEVLAVGDAEFQKKAIGKMKDVSATGGKTVLFVSHNMGAIKQLCTTGILMNNGQIEERGEIDQIIHSYFNGNDSKNSHNSYTVDLVNSEYQWIFKEIYISKPNIQVPQSAFEFESDICISFKLANCFTRGGVPTIVFRVMDSFGKTVFVVQNSMEALLNSLQNKEISPQITLQIPGRTLMPGEYYIKAACHVPYQTVYDVVENKLRFTIDESGSEFFRHKGTDLGYVNINCKWF